MKSSQYIPRVTVANKSKIFNPTATMTSNNIPQLPVEIFEIILSHLDGMTFARACFVCKTWKSISERLSIKPSPVWQNICRKEMRLEDLAEIVQQWYPAARMETYWTDQQIDWQEIFKFSQVWKLNSGSTLFEPRTIHEERHDITCAKLTGSCIVTGHADGTVRIWSQDGVFLECLANHGGLVTDLELISFHHELLEYYWDICHEFVISTSHDRAIQINYVSPKWIVHKEPRIILQEHSFPTNMVRAHENYFVVFSTNGHLSVWHMVAPKDNTSMPTVFNIAHIQEHSLALSLWSNRYLGEYPQFIVTGITPKGCHLEVLVCSEYRRNSPLFWSRSVGSVPQLMPNELWDGSATKLNAEGIMKCYVWRQDLFVIITARQSLCISIDGKHYTEYDTFSCFCALPTRVLVWQHMFLLGLNSGAVALFYFEDPKELLTLDLEHPSRLLQMSGDPISYLAISATPENTTLLAVAEESMSLCYLV